MLIYCKNSKIFMMHIPPLIMNFFVLFLIQSILTLVLSNELSIIIEPGNPAGKIPQRIWSGNPCKPCNVKQIINNIAFPIAACFSPCSEGGTKACLQISDTMFKCVCKPEFKGKFCQTESQKEIKLKNLIKPNSDVTPFKIGVRPDDDRVESDWYFKCPSPDKNIYYELLFLNGLNLALKEKSFENPEKQLDLPFNKKCNVTNSDGTCNTCSDSSLQIDGGYNFTEQNLFGDIFWEPYLNIASCTNIYEAFVLRGPDGYEYANIRETSNCDKREENEIGFRSGCRIKKIPKENCIANVHMAHRCALCEKGAWGDKCQFVDECDWWKDFGGRPGGCPDEKYLKDGPCGKDGICISRPNGKFCICPPGKIDGFTNVYNDRIKNSICSPAGKFSNDNVPKPEDTIGNSVLMKNYQMFLDLSPFHTYLGCQIDDPCYTFKDCENNGRKQIVNLIDENTPGFQENSRMRFMGIFPYHAIEVSKKLSCKCICQAGFSGETCEAIDPCHFVEQNYCMNGGNCFPNFMTTPVSPACECPEQYEGERCQHLNLCKISSPCDSGVSDCYPCKHHGLCVVDKTTDPYLYTCDCKGTGYLGKECECAKGEINLSIRFDDIDNVVATKPYQYVIKINKKGDHPSISVDMGDNITIFDVDYEDFKQEEYDFSHTYSLENHEYTAQAIIRNCDSTLEESSNSTILIFTISPPIDCLPGVKLKNVGMSQANDTEYKRTNAFTVEVTFTDSEKCNKDDLNHLWTLHKLSERYPIPVPENNIHVERLVTDSTETYITFPKFSLVDGLYYIEYKITIKENVEIVAKGFFNIQLDPPVIVIKGGEGTRVVDVSKVFKLDASMSYDADFPEQSHQLMYTWSCHEPCNIGPWKESVVTIAPGTFQTNQSFEIHLDITTTHGGNSRQSNAKINITTSTSSLTVNCLENCSPLNPGDHILVYCECSTCKVQPSVQFSWEPSSDNVIIVPEKNASSFATITLPTVPDSKPRTVVCTTTGGNVQVSKFSVMVNRPPFGGICSVNLDPPEGVYLKTSFDFICEGFYDQDQPLVYSFYSHVSGDMGKDLNNAYLLAHDTNPTATNIYLPYSPDGDDTVVEIKVTDSNGLSSTPIRLNVKITRPDATEYPDLLKNLIYGENSSMKNHKEKGDDQKAMMLQLCVLHGLLDGEFSGLSFEEFAMLREAISEVLSKIPLHSFKAVEQTMNSLYLLTQWGNNEKVKELSESSVVLSQSATTLSQLVAEDRETIPTETIKILATAATDSARRILKVSHDAGVELMKNQPIQPTNERQISDYDSEDEIDRDYHFIGNISPEDELNHHDDLDVDGELSGAIQNYSKISRRSYHAFGNLLDAVGERVAVGENFSVITDDVAIYVESDRQLDPSGLPINIQPGLGKGIDLKISGDLQNILKSQRISHIQIQVTEVLENPYFDDTSSVLGTPVVSVIIKDATPGSGRLPIELHGVEKPFEFTMPLTPTAKGLLEMSRSERTITLKPLHEASEIDLLPFHLILPYNTRVEIIIDEHFLNAEFAVVTLKDYWPTKQDFCENSTNVKILNGTNGYSTFFETEKLGLNEEPEEYFLEYFVGIFMYNKPEFFNKEGKYSVYFTRASCMFRDENKNTWSEEGCVVANDTTATKLHCLCNHASIFAGTQFAVPNRIPTISIFDFDPEEFERNPVLLTTVCVLLIAYIIGMIICFLLDRRNKKREVGITIMADLGDNLNQSYYLITVMTGSSFRSGTTANVSMQLYGTQGRSQVYVLREKLSPVLNQGGIDTFLISSTKDLGELEKIRIWHDNAGSSPNWYCRKIVVKNVKSNKEWCIFINKWLHISGNQSTIIYEKPVATAKEYRNFGRRFRENLIDQFDNSHLWLSVIRHPSASRFTRCQRLSCAFAILTTYMLLNIMFYGIELHDPDDMYGIQTYVFALQLTLMAIPIGLILVMTFRRIRQRYIPTLIIWKNKLKLGVQEDAQVFVPEKPKVDFSKKAPNNFTNFGNKNSYDFMGSGDRNQKDNISEVSSNFSIPSTNIEDLERWLASDATEMNEALGRRGQYVRCLDVEEHATDQDLIAWGRMGLVHAVRAADPKSFVFSGEHDIPEVENLIDEEIKRHLLKAKLSTDQNVSQNQVRLRPQAFHAKRVDEEDLEKIQQGIYEKKQEAFQFSQGKEKDSEKKMGLAFETCKMSPQRQALCFLPWWFLYIAWLFCLGTIIACLYFTLIYGLHYGYLRSIDWLIGITSSFLMSLFIIQPLSILISALLLTICCPSRQWTIVDEERFQILIKEMDDLGKRLPLNFRVFQPERKHPPLSGHEIFKLKVEARQREKLKNALLKLIFYGFLLIPLIIIAYSGHSSDNFEIVDNIKNLLKLTDGEDSAFDIRSESDLFYYLERICIPSLHPEYTYNGVRLLHHRFDPVFLADSQNLLLGVPRIRQVRVPKGKCDVPNSVSDTFSECYSTYSLSYQDTESYDSLWRPASNSQKKRKSSDSNDIWKFHAYNKGFVRSRILSGQMASYDGGGYVAELGRNYRQSMSQVKFLNRTRWIDKQTRGIFIEFAILNPNVNLFVDIIVIVERGPSQTFQTSYQITPVVLSTDDDFETFPWVTLSYVMVLLALIILILIFLWNIFAPTELHVTRKMWFWLDVLMICCIIVSMSIALKKHFEVVETISKIENMKINEYISLQFVAYWNEVSAAAFSITQCICFMKIWKLCVLLDERFFVTSLTVGLAYNLIIAYFVSVLIILIAFACAGHFIFGSEMAQFDSFRDSLISVIGQTMDVTFSLELQKMHRVLGPIYASVFGFLVVCVFMNILLAVLNQSLHDAKMISRERHQRWNFSEVVNQFLFNTSTGPYLSKTTAEVPLLPDRLDAMKKTTADFFRQSLKSHDAKTMTAIKQYTDQLLQGTGCRIISRRSRRLLEDTARESRIDEMRLHTAIFLESRMGTNMNIEELEAYSGVNRAVVGLRIWKLEKRLAELKRKLNKLRR